jgi:NADPH-dependent glutamate synthase beta subunit-like oxidoreductase
MPGQGFYGIHIPMDKEEKMKEEGIMIIEYGMVTADCIGEELRQLFKGISKCSIKKMNEDNQYLITFPSESIREQFSRFRGFDFQTSIVKVKVIPTEMSYGADDNLDVV